MTSVRALWGIQCPECSCDHDLYVVAETTLRLHLDGTDEIKGPDWTKGSVCKCGACGHHGTVRDFSIAKTGAAL